MMKDYDGDPLYIEQYIKYSAQLLKDAEAVESKIHAFTCALSTLERHGKKLAHDLAWDACIKRDLK